MIAKFIMPAVVNVLIFSVISVIGEQNLYPRTRFVGGKYTRS